MEEGDTFKGENAKVTKAFAPKFMSTAKLIPLPLMRKGKISEIINQPIGPYDNCERYAPNINISCDMDI